MDYNTDFFVDFFIGFIDDCVHWSRSGFVVQCQSGSKSRTNIGSGNPASQLRKSGIFLEFQAILESVQGGKSIGSLFFWGFKTPWVSLRCPPKKPIHLEPTSGRHGRMAWRGGSSVNAACSPWNPRVPLTCRGLGFFLDVEGPHQWQFLRRFVQGGVPQL